MLVRVDEDFHHENTEGWYWCQCHTFIVALCVCNVGIAYHITYLEMSIVWK